MKLEAEDLNGGKGADERNRNCPRPAEAVRALVVEDSDADSMLLQTYLNAGTERFELERASDLKSAVARLREHPPEVVLVDLHLPDCAGVQVVRELRQVDPLVPIVAMSGLDDDEVALGSIKAGAQDFMAKRAFAPGAIQRVLTLAFERARHDARSQLLFEQSIHPTWVLDLNHRTVFRNPAADRLEKRGITPELLQPDWASSTPETVRNETFGDGEIWLEVHTQPTRWNGRPAHVLTASDVTEQRRAAELAIAMQRSNRLALLGQLAAGIAHDVNNPATYIQANLELSLEQVELALEDLHGDSIPQRLTDLRELLLDSQQGIKAINSVVTQLRPLGRKESESPEPIDLLGVAQAAGRVAGNHIRHRAQLVEDLEPVPLVTGQRGRLTNAVLNLLVNAADAIKTGAVEENCVTLSTRQEGNRCVLRVMDTGSGIPPEIADKVLRPFFTTKSWSEGTGMGLSICQETIRDHGGTLTFTSTPGIGTTFQIALPIASAPPPTWAPAEEAPLQSPTTGRSRVLVVDDSEPIQRSLLRLLRRNFDVAGALSGAEALELIGRRPFDVVLFDLMMPQMDGAEFYAELTRVEPSLAGRTVCITGGAVTQRGQYFLKIFDGPVIQKPMTGADLSKAIAKVLSGELKMR